LKTALYLRTISSCSGCQIATISRDAAYTALKPYIAKLWRCHESALLRYRKDYPDLSIHRKATRANILSDVVFANIITEFDEVPDTTIIADDDRRLRFLGVANINLWFKKLDDKKESSNVSTTQSDRLNRGQLTLFPEAVLLIAGYQLTADETAVKCMAISPPNWVRPRWFIDVEPIAQPTAMEIVPDTPRTTRLRIIIGEEQNQLEL
jgi:hypothetical protein